MSIAVSDAVSRILGSALDGITLRQSVVADNIANVDTPGYRASAVEFESSLRAAVDGGEFDRAGFRGVDVSASATDTPVGPNGNNVDLRKEMLAAVQTQYQYQVVSRAVTDHMGLLKTAIGAA